MNFAVSRSRPDNICNDRKTSVTFHKHTMPSVSGRYNDNGLWEASDVFRKLSDVLRSYLMISDYTDLPGSLLSTIVVEVGDGGGEINRHPPSVNRR